MTTENSRADALTYRLTEFDVLLDGYLEALQDGPRKEQVDARNELRLAYRTALLAASPVEQPAAAPTHYSSDGGLCVNCGYGLYDHKGGRECPPAPSPADERVAEYRHAGWWDITSGFAVIQKDDPNPGACVPLFTKLARAASASETGAEGVKPTPYAYHLLSGGKSVGMFMHADDGENDGWRQFTDGSTPGCELIPMYTAPHPAQADARVGLDEGQLEALQEAICWANDDGLPGTADQLRSILAAHLGQTESRAEVTGDTRERRHWNPVYNTNPVQRACGELPEGWEIQACMENGAGWVDVYDPTGEKLDFDSDADHFDWRIHEAIDFAIDAAEAAINTLQAEATDCGCATNEACKMKTDGSCWRAD